MSCSKTLQRRLSAVYITLSETTLTPISRSMSKCTTSVNTPPVLEINSEVNRFGDDFEAAYVRR
jgi:hypothetical protein